MTEPARPDQPSLRRTVLLHLGPGLLGTVAFAALAPVLHHNGLPTVWAMMASAVLVIAPTELALLRRAARKRSGATDLAAVVDLARPTRRDLVGRLLPTLAVAGIAPGLVLAAETPLRTVLAGWLPAWYSVSLPPLVGWTGVVTVVGWLVAFVVVGPVVEELYFRGWLLARLPGPRPVAAAVNAALFASYHLWQPATWLTVFVFALPLAFVATRPRGVLVATIVHVTVNAIAFAALLSGAAAR